MSELNQEQRYSQYQPLPLAPNNAYALLSLPFAFTIPVLGLIFALIGMRQIKETNERGDGFAKAGLIISIIQIVLILLYLLLAGAVFLPFLAELRRASDDGSMSI